MKAGLVHALYTGIYQVFQKIIRLFFLIKEITTFLKLSPRKLFWLWTYRIIQNPILLLLYPTRQFTTIHPELKVKLNFKKDISYYCSLKIWYSRIFTFTWLVINEDMIWHSVEYSEKFNNFHWLSMQLCNIVHNNLLYDWLRN